MAKIYILGHKNSDTDSVCASLSYAHLKNQLGEKAVAVLAKGRMNKETEFVLSHLDIDPPSENFKIQEDDKIILVDHNEPSQIDDRVILDNIIEIIDHHKLGGLSLSVPITVIIRPTGSTSTIIYQLYKEKNIAPEKKIAFCLLCGIISDTLLLTSPTTTEADRLAFEELTRLAEVEDVNQLAEQMFEAKSDISQMPLSDIVFADFKVFKMGNKNVGIGVFETVAPHQILARSEDIFEILNKEKNKYDLLFFGAVDIFKKITYLFLVSEKERRVAESVFGKKYKEENILELDGVVSRKKQIVPPLQEYLEANNEENKSIF